MRKYTQEERERAREKLPEPIARFLGSETLTNIYLGINEKLKLNLRQLMVVSEITNVTLLGLEEEHALETNLHQFMPELSNADMRELVADINDRVFKEAERRLRENILEPKPTLQTTEVETTENNGYAVRGNTKMKNTPVEEKLYIPVERENRPEQKKKETREDETEKPTIVEPPSDTGVQEPKISSSQFKVLPETTPEPTPTIAMEKLAAPRVVNTEDVYIKTGAGNATRTDPYREPIS